SLAQSSTFTPRRRGIHLTERLELAPFRHNLRAPAILALLEHAIRIGAWEVGRDPRGGVFRVADQLQRIPMLNRLSIGVHPVDVDPSYSRIVWIIVEQIQKIHVSPHVVTDSDDAMDDDTGISAFARDLAEVFSQRD